MVETKNIQIQIELTLTSNKLKTDTRRIYVFVDASPQCRGLELFASSFDLVINDVASFCQQRLMPQISIGHAMFSKVGKTVSLLWQCWLIAGPSFPRMRLFLDSITSICTDFGTERLVVDMPDILPDFIRLIGGGVPANIVPNKWLFPNAFAMAGWHHVFDGCIRYGLGQLDWFDPWLLELKSCLKFLCIFENSRNGVILLILR